MTRPLLDTRFEEEEEEEEEEGAPLSPPAPVADDHRRHHDGGGLSFEALKQATMMVDRFWQEEKYTDTFTRATSFSKDYGVDVLSHYKKKAFMALPDVLLQQFDKLQAKC